MKLILSIYNEWCDDAYVISYRGVIAIDRLNINELVQPIDVNRYPKRSNFKFFFLFIHFPTSFGLTTFLKGWNFMKLVY